MQDNPLLPINDGRVPSDEGVLQLGASPCTNPGRFLDRAKGAWMKAMALVSMLQALVCVSFITLLAPSSVVGE